MKLLFTHPQKFYKVHNSYYVGESFSSNILSRYTKLFEQVTFIGRVSNEKTDFSRKEQITNTNLIIKDIHTLGSNGLRKEVKNADFIIARLPSSLGLKTVKLAKMYKKPYLIELVGCPFDALWNHSLKGKPFAIMQYFQTRKAVLNAPFVLYVSSEFLPKRYPTKGKFLSCSDVLLNKLDDKTLVQRLSKINSMSTQKPIVLGTVGAVNIKYKGHKYVLKAIHKLKKQGYHFEYWIVGNGSPDKLLKLAKRLNIIDNVKIMGGLPHTEVFNFLDNIDVYIQPSLTEGLPRAVLEAMSRACPVIASNVGGIPELLKKQYLFSKKNVNEISELLIKLDQDFLMKAAIENFDYIKQFDNNVLDGKRNEFYLQFINEKY